MKYETCSFSHCVRNGGVRNEVYVRCSTNQSAAIAYVTLFRTKVCMYTSRFDQSEHGYSVRHSAYVTLRTSRCLYVRTLFNQSKHSHSVRNALRTSRGVHTLFDQSERGYSVRTEGVCHGVYVRCLTDHSAAIAYVTLLDQFARGVLTY